MGFEYWLEKFVEFFTVEKSIYYLELAGKYNYDFVSDGKII